MYLTAVNQALEWLEKNQDTPLDELLADAKADEEDQEMANIDVDAREGGGTMKSLVCNDCGKRFRNADLASYHASKTYAYGNLQPGVYEKLTARTPVNTPTSLSQPRR